jgi:hypothetical protein
MSSGRLKSAFMVSTLVTGLLTASQSQTTPRPHNTDKKKIAVKHPETPSVPTAPPAPLTLQQEPSTAPQVTFQNGQLTIVSPNSVLGEILRAVRSRTGASVDVPPNATERVVGKFGPGPARDVLASLLNGSHFNYILLGSASNPVTLERVVLIAKTGEAETTTPVAQASATQPATAGTAPPPGEPPSSEPMMSDDEDPSLQDTSQQVDDGQVQQEDNGQQQPTGAPGIRTPEQMLQEMQRQQQIQQQQQNGTTAPPAMAPPGAPPFQPQNQQQ